MTTAYPQPRRAGAGLGDRRSRSRVSGSGTADAGVSSRDTGLLQRCQQQIRDVLPSAPTGLEDLQHAISEHRGRPVRVLFTDPGPLTLPAALWLQLHDHDLVWIDRRTSPMMRVVAACHEFGHIINGHQPASDESTRTGPAVATLAHNRLGLPAGAIAAIMMRCGDPHDPGSRQWTEEREAELTGRLLAARVLRHPRGLAAALTEP